MKLSNEMTISFADLSEVIEKIVGEYTEEVKDVIEESEEIARKKTLKFLKDNSPKKSGKYAKSWTSKKVKSPWGVGCIIYNKQGRLTHLLNNGHAKANQYGKYSGVTRGDKHISKAEEYGKKIFLDEIKTKLGG